MNKLKKICVSIALIAPMLAPSFVFRANAENIITPATGYTKAEEVEYKKTTVRARDGVTRENVVANWGARGETATFLSSYAVEFYEADEQYAILSQKKGDGDTSNTQKSELFRELSTVMSEKQTYYTYYEDSQNVRDFYKYTDCVKNDTSQVSIIYRGDMCTSEWNKGKIWNQEHMWPKSKLSTDEEIGDIMHLRPANPSENTGRSNDAYGESNGYYTPKDNVRGDCARTMLYMYVRYGSSKMWGKYGVFESLDILLKWMEQDPVDTWEMGRNDSVQTVTGTRNVFVDYPEYAWLLFGEEVPADMITPSGMAKNQQPTTPNEPSVPNEPNEPTTPNEPSEPSEPNSPSQGCEHEYSEWTIVSQPTETKDGFEKRTCKHCGDVQVQTLPKTGGEIVISCESAIGLPLAGISLLCAAGVICARKRKKDE